MRGFRLRVSILLSMRASTTVLLLLLIVPTAAHAASGGATMPTNSGGSQVGVVPPPSRTAPRLVQLTVDGRAMRPTGGYVGLRFRIARGTGRVAVRLALTPAAGGSPVARVSLRPRRPGRMVRTRWRPGALTPGRYVLSIAGVDSEGEKLVVAPKLAAARGSVSIVPAAPAASSTGVFPIQGAYVFGMGSGRFGDDRGTHRHQGQDVSAAEGTPLVNPVAGTVTWRAYQASGAGHYIVIRGAADGRDRVFMHMKSGSVLVKRGQAVAAGQPIGQVGSTGRSTGAHLHYEHWVGGWQEPGGRPIDPLPELRAWAARR